ncbi:META domain-containing protein [Flavobacterium terrigena]|uniref:Heat shock protein HslJ n=1 Tax=Flavobacterium terrigena TaxID=402734 RepID=A0A1H6UPF4_9FLAO|nr:META domain-containing protein [Flavobacterium terrigena]SEI94141.1 Heat shock protein HslJ [Flavobacterium terrigena]
MKKHTQLFICLLTLILSGCTTLKSTAVLSNETWELEYITGPRITFEGLFPENKPQITFNTTSKEVSGTTGCNGFATKYTSEGQKIKFDENFPTTMRYCEGGGEQVFLKMIKEVNNYYIDNEGKLFLNKDDVPMMRFKKIAK